MKISAEVVLHKDVDGWTATIPQFNNVATSSETREGAILGAQEILEIEAGDLVREKAKQPLMQHLAEVVILNAEVNEYEAKQMEYTTKEKVCEWLELPSTEVDDLLKHGVLKAEQFDNEELILIDSLNNYHHLENSVVA